MPAGKLYIVSAPSGAGKTSLLQELIKAVPKLHVSISHTTRAPRPGEVDGVNYHFVDTARFEEMVQQDEFLEYARVFDHYYGTSGRAVKNQLNNGENVILEIDWQGARIVRQKMPQAISIFILPPTVAELERRLRLRAQDSDTVIARRMRDAAADIEHFSEFDYLVLNDEFDSALARLQTIIHSPQDYRPPADTILSALRRDIARHGR